MNPQQTGATGGEAEAEAAAAAAVAAEGEAAAAAEAAAAVAVVAAEAEAAPAASEATAAGAAETDAVVEKDWFYTDIAGGQLGPTKTSDMLALLAAGVTLTPVRSYTVVTLTLSPPSHSLY